MFHYITGVASFVHYYTTAYIASDAGVAYFCLPKKWAHTFFTLAATDCTQTHTHTHTHTMHGYEGSIWKKRGSNGRRKCINHRQTNRKILINPNNPAEDILQLGHQRVPKHHISVFSHTSTSVRQKVKVEVLNISLEMFLSFLSTAHLR